MLLKSHPDWFLYPWSACTTLETSMLYYSCSLAFCLCVVTFLKLLHLILILQRWGVADSCRHPIRLERVGFWGKWVRLMFQFSLTSVRGGMGGESVLLLAVTDGVVLPKDPVPYDLPFHLFWLNLPSWHYYSITFIDKWKSSSSLHFLLVWGRCCWLLRARDKVMQENRIYSRPYRSFEEESRVEG